MDMEVTNSPHGHCSELAAEVDRGVGFPGVASMAARMRNGHLDAAHWNWDDWSLEGKPQKHLGAVR